MLHSVNRQQSRLKPPPDIPHVLTGLLQSQGMSAATKRGAPICYDFVKGSCTRGAECRYSHDISSVINSSKARPVGPAEPCFDFLR